MTKLVYTDRRASKLTYRKQKQKRNPKRVLFYKINYPCKYRHANNK